MKNINNKNKYLLEILAFAFVFLVFAFPAFASQITPDKVVDLVNSAREKENLENLSINEKLMNAANDKLNDMIKNNYFAHTSPSGTNPWYWFSKNAYDYQYAGENLAINFLSAEDQQEAWMKSPTHRKNILNSNYSEIGVAVGAGEIDGQVSIIAVQEFGARVGADIAKNGKNFSNINNANLMKDGEKILPQVLSVKNSMPENGSSKNNSSAPQKYLQLIELFSNLAVIVFFASLALLPLAFLSVAFEKIFVLWENKKGARLQTA